ncbi:MAG: porin [Desulfobacteraceae bacterium]
MKKIVVGIIMASFVAVVGSSHAATVFKKNNFTYEIKGDWQIQMRQDPGKDQDMDLEYDDLEIKNKVSYDINDALSAFGELDLGFKNAADESNEDDADPHLEEAYLGFKIQDVKLFFGKTDSAGDEFGVAATYETIVADDCFDEFGAVDGDDLIGLSTKVGGMLNVYATYEIEAESEKSDHNGSFFDIYADVELQGVTLGAAYQNLEPYGSNDDTTIWGVQASYDAEFAAFGADYSVTDDADDSDETVWNLFVEVPVKPVTIAMGYVALDYDDGREDETVAGWYGNVTYKFPTAKNVSLFAEISDSDETDVDLGYLVGARLKF